MRWNSTIQVPKSPLIFMKPATALLTDGKPFYHPDFSENIHHEIELVLKIRKNGKNIVPGFGNDYYDEIGLGIDFTARDLQDKLKEKGQPWNWPRPLIRVLFWVVSSLRANGVILQTSTFHCKKMVKRCSKETPKTSFFHLTF